jgi:alkylhydroperoxidase family enzyme
MLLAVTLMPDQSRCGEPAHVPILTDAQAWKTLPPVETGLGRPLPVWIRALAVSLPKTAAAMIDLDHAQRAESSLPPRLRARLRWIAADANRCPYARAYARADYVWAGGPAEDLDNLSQRLDQLPETERLALQFVRQLCLAAYSVSDAQVARLVELYGEKQVVAMVLVAAYANFQDRLLLALGVGVEPNGPLPPVEVRFRQSPTEARAARRKKEALAKKEASAKKAASTNKDASAKKEEKAPKRKLSPPVKNPPPLPERMDDPEWTAIPFDSLRQRLTEQMGRRQARISVPDAAAVLKSFPEKLPKPDDAELLIRWSRLNYAYQPRLTMAWFAGLDAFHEESDLDMAFHESMFWVVTRSLQCFY